MTGAGSRLEYAAAFDIAANYLQGYTTDTLAVVSLSEFAEQLLMRALGGVTLICDEEVARHARALIAAGWLNEQVARATRICGANELAPGTFSYVLWVAPQRSSWTRTLQWITTRSAPGATLCVLTGTTWNRLIQPLRRGARRGEPFWRAGALRTHLRRSGWRIERSHGLGGAEGAVWASLRRGAVLGRRPDLADRMEAAHHLAVDQALAPCFQLIAARRP